MSSLTPDPLARLRAANPAPVKPDQGRDPVAQAALKRIIADPHAAAPPSRRHGRSRTPRRLALVLAVMVLGSGGALAATDPMGWWSANPTDAKYGANPAQHVPTPAAQEIRCRPAGGVRFRCAAERQVCGPTATGGFRCVLTGTGMAYTKLAAIPRPVGSLFSRRFLLAYITAALSKGTMSATEAAKFRGDLAHAPDSFFTEYRLASRFGTFGAESSNSRGQSAVPPPGEPNILVCENAGRALSCQNLNGDLHAPIGAGIYGAQVTPAWRVAPARRQDTGLPPGIHFTRAEYQVLIDMVRYATVVSHSSGPSRHLKPVSRR